jgi:MFS family permease
MTVYTLWTNWTTLYLEAAHGLSLAAANWLAPIPLLFAYLGGLFGGWLSLRWMNAGLESLAARMRACRLSAVALVATVAAAWTPSPVWTTAAISFSFFWIASFSVNLYTLPLDAFGLGRAAFSVSLLTSAYGLMQAVFSPWIGSVIDRHGYRPVILLVAVLPLAAFGCLKLTRPRPLP